MIRTVIRRTSIRAGLPLALAAMLLAPGCTVRDSLLVSIAPVTVSEDTVLFRAVVRALNGADIVFAEDKLFREGEDEGPDEICIEGFAWDFGDGTTGSGQTVSHTYAAPGTYVVTLTVVLCDGPPIVYRINVTVGQAVPDNDPPVADAGTPQEVFRGANVTLDGSGSFDPNDDPITYAWRVVAVPEGSEALVTGLTTVSPAFVPDVLGDYDFELIVNDGEFDSLPDTVRVTAVNRIPVADAGPDQTVFATSLPGGGGTRKGETGGDTIVLDGSGSFDADDDPLTYAWRFLSVPAGSAGPAIAGADTVSPSFVPDALGEYELELTVNDGFADSLPDTVTVVYRFAAPVISGTANEIDLECGGVFDPVVTAVDIFGADITGSIVVSGDAVDTRRPGVYVVVYDVTDAFGNAAETFVLTVTVRDTTPPVARTRDITVTLDANGTARIGVPDIDNGSSDNCDLDLSIAPDAFDCATLGAQTVALTAVDGGGLTDTALATVTVVDTTPPVVAARNITLALDANGRASITPAGIDGGSSDNCSVALTAEPLTFDCSDIGPNTVTLTGRDPSGNTATATAIVTIADTAPPVARTRNITVELDAQGTASIVAAGVDDGSTDNCAVTLSVDPAVFDCSDVGVNLVTLTATDPSGNTATAPAAVTVEDNIAPTVSAQGITVSLDAQGSAAITPSDIGATGSDNCASSLDVSPLTFDCSDLGPNAVTVTNTDPSGNTARTTVTVIVQDTAPPAALARDITVELDANGAASIVAADVDDGSSDNCAVTLGVEPAVFDCSDVGANVVTLTAADPSGNRSAASATVTVRDSIAPAVSAQDITVQLDAQGTASITLGDLAATGDDNCSVTLDASPLNFDCSDLGPNAVTVTGADPSGNTASVAVTVTVQDGIAPLAVARNITVELDANGVASIVAADVDGGSSDNCAVTLTAEPLAFGCNDLGPNAVTLTAADPSGNVSTAQATVTVVDNLAPTVSAQSITVQLDAEGLAAIALGDLNVAGGDNCASSLEAAPLNFDCSNLGPNAVTVTNTDPSGNMASTVVTVTVEDAAPPTVDAQDVTVQLDAQGQASVTLIDLGAVAGDNCDASLDAAPLSFDCSNAGPNAVTVTATDPSGNTASTVVTVTVEDIAPPTVDAQDFTVQLDAQGAATITLADIAAAGGDNCGTSLDASPLSFDCSNVGPNVVTVTNTDPSGNAATTTVTVTVEDSIAPVALARDITVELDAAGNASIAAADVDAGSSDNCSVVLTAEPLTFDCTNLGPNPVTLTATDPSGNTAQAVATVTVVDATAPVVGALDITVQVDSKGFVGISLEEIGATAEDNCGATLEAEPLFFDCGDLGPNTVTVTSTDPSGNTTTFDVTVTVEDNEAPFAFGSDTTVQLDAQGAVAIDAVAIGAFAGDNCRATLEITPASFDCSDVGPNVVTLTATDPSGNTDSTTVTVTVEDTVAPVALARDITVQLDASGAAAIGAADIEDGSSDNCAVTLSAEPLVFDCSNVGPNLVTLTATDPSGNTANAVATVTVEDSLDPTVSAFDATFQLDAQGALTLTLGSVDATGEDNCDTSLSIDPVQFDCTDIGPNAVTVTNTDPSGNTATTTVTVTIEDAAPPTALTQDITVQLDAGGAASIAAAQVDNGSVDNCSVTLEVEPAAFDCGDVGAVQVTLTATDPSGNSASATATVTVEDGIAPVVVAQDATVELDASGQASIVAADVDDGSSDNCSVDLAVDPSVFTCQNVGQPVLVTLTGTDPSGNSAQDTAFVTVVDLLPPAIDVDTDTIVIQCEDPFSPPPAQGEDNCDGEMFVAVDDGVDPSTPGNYQVTYTSTDNSGNTTVVTVDVVVVGTCFETFNCVDTVLPPGDPDICFDFETDFEGFTIDNTNDGLWGRTDLCPAPTVPNGSSFVLYFGDTASCTYDTGTPVAGTATSPPIDLTGATGSIALSLLYIAETENSGGFVDESAVEVSTDGVNFNPLASTAAEVADLLCDDGAGGGGKAAALPALPKGITATWKTAVLDLSDFAGQTINLRLRFDSVDSANNAFLGFAVDELCIYDYSN